MKTLNMSHVWWDMLKTKVVIYSLRNGLSLGINGFIRKCILSGCKIATLARDNYSAQCHFLTLRFVLECKHHYFPWQMCEHHEQDIVYFIILVSSLPVDITIPVTTKWLKIDENIISFQHPKGMCNYHQLSESNTITGYRKHWRNKGSNFTQWIVSIFIT